MVIQCVPCWGRGDGGGDSYGDDYGVTVGGGSLFLYGGGENDDGGGIGGLLFTPTPFITIYPTKLTPF